MNLRGMEYFAETVRVGSFTKAANNLYVSQPALSKAIQNIETELNVILVDRNARGFQLTENGKVFYEYAVDMLRYYGSRTEKLLSDLRCKAPEISLGITPTSGAMFFFSTIYKFRNQYPMSSLKIAEVRTKDGIDMVINGKLDMSVVIEPFYDDRMEKINVVESEAVLLVSTNHRLAGLESVSISEVINEPMLMVSKEYMYSDVVSEYIRNAGYEPKYSFESNQWEFIFEMVANGQGISILPKPLVDKFNNNRVKQIHLKNPEFNWTLALIRRKDGKNCSLMKSFWNLCQNEKIINKL